MPALSRAMTSRSRLLTPWDLVPLGALLGDLALFALLRPRFQGLHPVHWGLHGQPDRWVGPSRALLEGVSLGVGLWLLLLALEAVGRELPALSAMLRPLRSLMPTGAFLLAASLLAGPVLGERSLGLGIGALLVCMLAGLVTGLARLPEGALDPAPDDPALQAPGAWKGGGLFYRNPRDPRLWVPKREGGGWTVNLAHPRGRRVFILLVALPLALVAFLLLLGILS